MRAFIVLVMFFNSFSLSAQTFYFSEYDGWLTYSFGMLDISGQCSDVILYQTEDKITGVTQHPNGEIYAVFDSITLKKWDALQQDFIFVTDLPFDSRYMTCSPQGTLFFYGTQGLHAYDLTTEQAFDFGKVWTNNVEIAGSITFINGNLYMAGGAFDSKMAKINLSNPAESTLVDEGFDFDPWPIRALTTFYSSCDSALLYFTVWDWDGNHFYSYDLNTGDYQEVCIIDSDILNNIDDMSHPSEFQIMDCTPILDLDTTDVFGYEFSAEVVCASLPYLPFTGASMGFVTPSIVDSLWIGLVGGDEDGFQESIACVGALPVPCTMSNGGLLLDNSSQLPNADLLNWVASGIQYDNAAMPVTPGVRELAVVAYHDGYVGDTVILHLPIGNQLGAGADGTVELCENGAVIDLSDSLGGTPSNNGSWSPSTSSSNGIFDPLSDVPGIYTYTVNNGICPDDSAQVTVIVHEPPVFTLGADTMICTGDELVLQVGTMAESYLWQDGSDSPAINADAEGLYWLEVTDSNGCQWRDSIQVAEGESVQVDSFVVLCEGEFFNYMGESFTTDTLLCSDNVSSAIGCDSTFCLHLDFQPAPNLSISGELQLCPGDSTFLIADGDFSEIVWSTNETSSTITVNEAGTYSVVATNIAGCSVTQSVEVVEGVEPVFSVVTEPPSCEGDTDGALQILDLEGIAPFTVLVDNVPVSEPYLTNGLGSGFYTVEVIGGNGCSSIVLAEVPVVEELWLEVSGDSAIYEGESALVELHTNATDIIEVRWEPEEGVTQMNGLSASVSPPIGTTPYEVYLTTGDGCILFASFEILVEEAPDVYMPTVFSPNGDGINDFYKPYASEGIEIHSLKIYNRWGGLVFDGEGVVGWDGTRSGKRLGEGVYVYLLEVKFPNEPIKSIAGDLLLIR